LLLTWNNEDSDNDLRRHHLDHVARPLTCPVVAIRRRRRLSIVPRRRRLLLV
jgi:hypothetical protein